MVRLDHCVQLWLRRQGAACASLKESQRRVRAGEVSLDGMVFKDPKCQFVPDVEEVSLTACGTRIDGPCLGHAFYIMNKPIGFVCQRHPREPHVYSLISDELARPDLGCVGRLDRDTTGALMFCTDGGVQSLLLHPSSRVWKAYWAELSELSTLAADAVDQFTAGMVLEDGTSCAPASLEVLHADSPIAVRVTLHEGFFHQVKRMLRHVGGEVVKLHRERFGLLDADDLSPGEMRRLTQSELRQLANEMLPIDRKCEAGQTGRHPDDCARSSYARGADVQGSCPRDDDVADDPVGLAEAAPDAQHVLSTSASVELAHIHIGPLSSTSRKRLHE